MFFLDDKNTIHQIFLKDTINKHGIKYNIDRL